MELKDVLTNEFTVRYDVGEHSLLIYRQLDPSPEIVPIRYRLSMLQEMGREQASKWIGNTFLMLVPELREKVLGEADSSEEKE